MSHSQTQASPFLSRPPLLTKKPQVIKPNKMSHQQNSTLHIFHYTPKYVTNQPACSYSHSHSHSKRLGYDAAKSQSNPKYLGNGKCKWSPHPQNRNQIHILALVPTDQILSANPIIDSLFYLPTSHSPNISPILIHYLSTSASYHNSLHVETGNFHTRILLSHLPYF